MMAKFKAWQKWRDNHKNITALQQTLGGFQLMEQDPRTQLNKAQAHTVLAVLGKWRAKPVMTDAQARQVNQQITASADHPADQKDRHGVRRGAGRRPRGRLRGRRAAGAVAAGAAGRVPAGPARSGVVPRPHGLQPAQPGTIPFPRARPRTAQRLNDLVAMLKQAK